MKKIGGICNWFIFTICFILLSISAEATTEIEEHNHESEEMVVEDLEGVQLKKIEYIQEATGSCQGLMHNWQVIQTIQEQTCGVQGIWRIQCAGCGVTTTTFSDIREHNYVEGTCTYCDDTIIEVAPEGEIDNWEYNLNEADKTIILKQYIGESSDVIVYGTYSVNDINYTAILNGDLIRPPFYNKRDSLLCIKINSGVISYDCTNLFSSLKNLLTLNINGLDTSNVSYMSYMFSYSSGLTNLNLSSLDTSNVVNMDGMFSHCSNLTELDLNNFDTSNVTGMYHMFSKCSSLTNLNLGNFDTSNVTNMDGMFSHCLRLTYLDISNFNTSNATYMSYMFSECRSLTNLNLSNFDTSNVINMDGMFSYCSNLTDLDLNNFNTSNVTGMYHMFSECSSLTNLNLSNFDTSNVTNMDGMFVKCKNLIILDLSSYITYNVENMSYMFFDCEKLSTIYVNRVNWNTSYAATTDMFLGCGTSRVSFK